MHERARETLSGLEDQAREWADRVVQRDTTGMLDVQGTVETLQTLQGRPVFLYREDFDIKGSAYVMDLARLGLIILVDDNIEGDELARAFGHELGHIFWHSEVEAISATHNREDRNPAVESFCDWFGNYVAYAAGHDKDAS